jgi:hypothetical protein
MLHHGEPGVRLPRTLLRSGLRRFDVIVAISDAQEAFYRAIGVFDERVVRMSSYVLPESGERDESDTVFSGWLADVRKRFRWLVVASGFPRAMYRHDWTIEYVSGRSDAALLLFCYGAGETAEALRHARSSNVFVLFDREETQFNSALKVADIYVRPTAVDSFGVAAADAINFGCVVVASDVCQRYQGSILFEGLSTDARLQYTSTLDGILSGASDLRKETRLTQPFSIDRMYQAARVPEKRPERVPREV